MAARYSYSNPYQVDQLAMYQYEHQLIAQSGTRRFFSAIGRFFYRLIVLALVLAAVGGVLFALYRNGVLHTIARGAGIEAQFRSFEKATGAQRWAGLPAVELPPDSIAAAAPADAKDPSEKPAETVNAAATSGAKTSTGVAIVSFDSLPTVSKKGAAEADSTSTEPPVSAKTTRPEPVTIAQAAAAPPRERKAPKAEPPKAKPAKPTELTRSIPLPKAPPKEEPVAKAEPAPKPEPPAPKPEPEVDRTKPRAGDNPLKAAIREAMAAKKKSE
jgi:hypothetical protein